MQLVLNPADNAAHDAWLCTVPGAYEWWYFDAVSEDGEWSLACIWFLGNPFSPYYRLAARGVPADPYAHNALFFALSQRGRLHAYHFTRFPKTSVCADAVRPAELQFGENRLTQDAHSVFQITLRDTNANGGVLAADLAFDPGPGFGQALVTEQRLTDPEAGTHCWMPAAPACRVLGSVRIKRAQNRSWDTLRFRGDGYHDHNWGNLPFEKDIRDWYWARVTLGSGDALVLYFVRSRDGRTEGTLLRFLNNQMVFCDRAARVSLENWRINAFGLTYASRLAVSSNGLNAVFDLRERLDSAPFYLRLRAQATVTGDGQPTAFGQGIGEYFRPQIMASPIVASAMKARIREA